MRRLLIAAPIFYIALLACSESSSSSASYDCNGGFPQVGDSCPTEGETCQEEGTSCSGNEPGSDPAFAPQVDICKNGRLVRFSASPCPPRADGGARSDAGTPNDSGSPDADASSGEDASDDGGSED